MTMSKANDFSAGDYEISAVPESSKKTLWTLMFIFCGWALNSSEIITGGTLANPLGFSNGLVAIFISIALLCVFASLISLIAGKTGLTFTLLTRYAFGNFGTKIPSLVLAVVHFGWYGILTAMCANIAVTLLNLDFYLLAVVIGLLIALTAVIGFRALAVIGYIAVPTVLIVGIVGVTRMFNLQFEGFMPPAGGVTMLRAISMGFGAYAVGATLTADVTRFAKTTKHAVIGMSVGIAVGLGFMRVLGALSVSITGESDIVAAFAAMGLPVAAFFFLLLNIWSTNDNILYSTGLSLSNIFNWNRMWLTLGVGIIGTFFAVSGLHTVFGSWLDFLAAAIPPIGAIVLCDYFFIAKGKYAAVDRITNNVNPFAFIAWAAGVIVALFNLFIPAIDGLIVAAILYFICMKFTEKNNPDYYGKLTNAADGTVSVVAGKDNS